MEQDSIAHLDWQTSSRCAGANCIQVADAGNSTVALRDSKNPDSGVNLYSVAQWRDFVAGVEAGDFDSLLS